MRTPWHLLQLVHMNMTEKIAKKVGEAHAFAHVLEHTFTLNEEVMSTLLSGYAGTVTDTAQAQKAELETIAESVGMKEIVVTKSEKTSNKITSMGETYVGDDWDDTAEVLEWMSFFVGGAIVHWQLIAGAAEKMEDEHFKDVAAAGTDYYTQLMSQLKEYAVIVGQQRAVD